MKRYSDGAFGVNMVENPEGKYYLAAEAEEEMERLRAEAPSGGVLAIHRERQAHYKRESWTDAQDDRYTNKQLAAAALNYLWHYLYGSLIRLGGMARWPWALSWFKPTSPRRCLEKAGALIAAELDRLHRAEMKEPDTNADPS